MKRERGFNTWYETAKSPRISRIARPKAHPLVLSDSYKAHGRLIPYTDSDGVSYPLNCVQELIPAANRHLKKCDAGRAYKTYFSELQAGGCDVPEGIFVYEVLVHLPLAHQALQEIDTLFKHPMHTKDRRIHMLKANPPPTNIILFYTRDEEQSQPTFIEAMQRVYEAAPALATYIMVYFNLIREILRIDSDEMEKCLLSLIHYDKHAGLNPHIDSIHMLGDTIGPIFTVAMGNAEKMMDMLPIMMDPHTTPVRIYSQPNQLMALDDPARIMWAHALPWRYPHEQYTVVFKFPALRTVIRKKTFTFEQTEIEIPYYIQSNG